MQPTSLHLTVHPWWKVNAFEGAMGNPSDWQPSLGSTVMIAQVDTYPAPHDCAHIPSMELVDLTRHFPHIRELELTDVVLQPQPFEGSLSPILRFEMLHTLSIDHWNARLSTAAEITISLFALFAHTPQLRTLVVQSPARRYVEHIDNADRLPDPPFSLEKFICTGILATPACARIIARSQSTLTELWVSVTVTTDEDDAHLVVAIAQAAPRLRYLDLDLGGKLPLVPRLQPVFAALTRLRETLRLTTPQDTTLPTTLGVLAYAPAGIPLRELVLVHGGVPSDPFITQYQVKQLIGDTPQTRRLRHLVLVDSYMGFEDPRDELELMELMRAHRIRCEILG
ncbi:hypothetical protein AURDEDRAFT_165096 [Auricularia subglabra TFB-10046 SS5]|nr:hypothetical protein AURDEDRAFT_165096 [Auricularia subglabra TFB-10046 SS5]